MSLGEMVKGIGKKAKEAAFMMAKASSSDKDRALKYIAEEIERRKSEIQNVNARDIEEAKKKELSGAKLARLELSDKVIGEMVSGIRDVIAWPDPIGRIVSMWTRPNGLRVGRMRIPLGVIGIIYESRPNVTVDASILCIKAGNAVILRGGSEAFQSNRCLADILRKGLARAGLPENAVQLVPTTDRSAVLEMLKLEDYIDVMIPRGGEELIRFVNDNATMPVLKHYKGVCHVFVDRSADIPMAVEICINAKVQKPGVCNAMETLLVHERIAEKFLPAVAEEMKKAGVELRGCHRTQEIIECHPATEDDWYEEYLDLILAIKVVSGMDEAIDHIRKYGSDHTEAIVTTEYERAWKFVQEVQSSLVLVNASTRFNDGYQLGLGAEIGISTSKLHAFGPMGVDELTTTKFVAFGDGQIRT